MARFSKRFAAAFGLAILLLAGGPARSEITSENNPRLKEALRRFPKADANGDGILTADEARALLEKTKEARGKSAAEGEKAAAKTPAPTFENVPYGPHERNVLDFWKAKSDKPTPVLVFIHGGGFISGDKSKARSEGAVGPYLEAGVSFAAINYRFRTTAPIQDILRDAARAIQFLRSKAAEWNIDKTRIASYGGSAGAGTSLWLAFHDDLADPKSTDLVLRESTRLAAAGSMNGQFTYDLRQWKDVLGVDPEPFFQGENPPSFYGLKTMEEVDGPEGKKIRADVDMRGLISRDDPPVFIHCSMKDAPVTTKGILEHSPKHSLALKERCDQAGVACEMHLVEGDTRLPAGTSPAKALVEFMLKRLGVKPPLEHQSQPQ